MPLIKVLGERIAIVCSGGGMRCSYAGGALLALVKEFNLTEPDLIIATSGSAGNAAYYLTRQYEASKIIWTELLPTSRFISLLRIWRMMDVNILVDEIFKIKYPLDAPVVRDSKTQYYIPVRDVQTRETRYITNDDSVDFFEVLRAAKALPFFFGGKVELQGRLYTDGGIGITFEQTIEDARRFGATRIIAIDTRSRSKQDRLKAQLSDRDIILISNGGIPADLITRDKEKLQRSFDLGYADAKANESLRRFLL